MGAVTIDKPRIAELEAKLEKLEAVARAAEQENVLLRDLGMEGPMVRAVGNLMLALQKVGLGVAHAPKDFKIPRGDGARRVVELETALRDALVSLSYYGPTPSHGGPCGGDWCDQECEDAALFAEDMQRWKSTLERKP